MDLLGGAVRMMVQTTQVPHRNQAHQLPNFVLILTQSPILSSELPATSNNNSSSIGSKAALTLPFSHALLSSLLIFLAGKPPYQLNNLVFLIIMGANAYIATPFSTLAILWAFYSQAQNIKSTSVPSALSRPNLVLQAMAFLTLAALWPFRLTLPQTPWQRQNALSLVMEWSCIVGWAHINYVVIA